MKKMDLLIVDTHTFSTFGFTTEKNAQKDLTRAKKHNQKDVEHLSKIVKDYPDSDYFEKCLSREKKCNYQIMTFDDYLAQKKEYYLSDPVQEISEDEYYENLNVLPPLFWCIIDGVDMFCMSEFYTDSFTAQYAKYNGKYYCKMVDAYDKTTWINNFLNN